MARAPEAPDDRRFAAANLTHITTAIFGDAGAFKGSAAAPGAEAIHAPDPLENAIAADTDQTGMRRAAETVAGMLCAALRVAADDAFLR